MAKNDDFFQNFSKIEKIINFAEILKKSSFFAKILKKSSFFDLQHPTYSAELRPATRIDRQARCITGSAIIISKWKKYQTPKQPCNF